MNIAMLAATIIANGVTVSGVKTSAAEWAHFDDGDAVRYVLPDGKRHIESEDTAWTMPEDARVWFQAEQGPWRIDYEAPYTNCLVRELREGTLMAMPVTAALPDGSYAVMTEANVVDYTDSAIVYRGDGKFAVEYYADPKGFWQEGGATTPWRLMVRAKDLQTLATTDIVRRLCPETTHPLTEKFAGPGRCVWHWLPMGDPIFAEQKAWYDKTKELGFEYYLIDEGWRKWGDDVTRWLKLKECIDYGKSVGVESFIWVDSKEMRTAEARREYLKKTVAAGAVGIKIDFIPKPSYSTMKWYEETLADTYAAGLRVDFHGAVKPSGREKTWPHEIAREAIRGHEWHITRYKRVLPPEHDTILPFCRLVQGHGDYTPVVFNKKELIHFTWSRQLAQGIVFACPFLCFGDYPANYLANPAVETIKALPAVYDETIVLAGSEIGECVAMARRKGNVWFVGVENGAKEREITIDFSFLKAPAKVIAYGDTEDGRLDAYRVERFTVAPGDRKTLRIRGFGGWVANTAGDAESVPPWEDPGVNAINRLPARAIVVPCENEAKAVAIAKLELPREASAYIESLNGEWDFTFYPNYAESTDRQAAESPNRLIEKRKNKITVPGSWQLQGDYDPPLYINDLYPFPVRPPIASGLYPEIPAIEPRQKGRIPQNDWTIFAFPDPVGIYEREFSVPAQWEGRRIVIHFGGVSSAMTLYVNGKEVGYSEDSRLPAEFDITDYLAAKEARNTLKVVVRKHCDGSYLEDQDFWRLSGVFRDVWLVAEKKDGLHDFIVETDAKTGQYSIRGDNGTTVALGGIMDMQKWSPENPSLYTIAFQYAGDWFAANIAFRTVAIEDGVFKLNGERVLFKGVNRHEISPVGGYALTHEEMERDIKVLKEFGFNAVRTCHYPDDPYWYDLCDKYGIMLVSEANIESHGMNERFFPGEQDFAKRPEWLNAHLERGGRMVETFRNHPSIVMWSMGNECDMGPAFEEEYRLMKSLDPEKRPVQYERVQDYPNFAAKPFSDTICPMYPHPAQVEATLKRETSQPFIMCEYAHAMGNSTGSFDEYWALAEKYPTFQGGFIWDFADQGLLGKDGNLKYGGDYGDKPNTGNGHCNGIFDAWRKPHPAAYEVKEVFETFGASKATYANSDYGFKPNFMRARTDNDIGWRLKDRGWTGDAPTITTHSDGSIEVEWSYTLAEGEEPPPRIGLTFTVPAAFTNIAWVGRGPRENYPDRKRGAHFGTWAMPLEDFLDEARYIRPQECAYRCDTARLELFTSYEPDNEWIVIETLGAPFGFSVWPWTQEDLEKANHVEELVKRDFLTVNIDAFMLGVGGDDSWGAKPHGQYWARQGECRLHLIVRKSAPLRPSFFEICPLVNFGGK